MPKVSAETPPAEVIEEKDDVMLPPSLSESSESVSVSVSTLESDSVYTVLVLNEVVDVTVIPVCGLK